MRNLGTIINEILLEVGESILEYNELNNRIREMIYSITNMSEPKPKPKSLLDYSIERGNRNIKYKIMDKFSFMSNLKICLLIFLIKMVCYPYIFICDVLRFFKLKRKKMNKDIKKIIGLLLIAIGMSICFAYTDVNKEGSERWDVKTLTDKDTSKINFTPQEITIDSLITKPIGKKISNNLSRFGLEFNTYTIKCKIAEYKREDDGDYHLVLMDSAGNTMIGEIPDPSLTEIRKSCKYIQIDSVRSAFAINYMLSGNAVRNRLYTITGVAFFDKLHGQLGVAPNGIELHPILKIE